MTPKKALLLRTVILFFFFISISFKLTSQTKVDSLYSILNETLHDTTKSNLYVQIADSYKDNNQDSTILYLKKAINCYVQEPDKQLTNLYLKLGKYYKHVNYDSALVYFAKVFDNAQVSNDDFLRAEALLYEGMTLFNQSKDSACIDKIEKAAKLYEHVDNIKGLFDCYNSLVTVFINFGDAEKSIEYCKKSIEIASLSNDSVLIAKSFYTKGSTYTLMAKYSEALESLFKALDIYEKINYNKQCAQVLSEIGSVYHNLEDNLLAKNYFIKSRNYFESVELDWELGNCYILLGGAYQKLNNLDSAVYYTKKGQDVMLHFGDVYSVAGININLGNIEKSRDNYTESVEYYNKALSFMEENNQVYYVSMIHNNIGNTYNTQKKYTKAIEHYNLGIKWAKNVNAESNLLTSYNQLADIYKSTGNFKKALHFIENAILIKDSITSKDNRNTILELETKYQTEQKELQIARLNEEKLEKELLIKDERLKRIIAFVILAIFVLIFAIVVYVVVNSSRKRRLQAERREKELIEKAQKDIEVITLKKNKEKVSVLERELKVLSQEIHDGILSDLTGIQFLLGSNGSAENNAKALQYLKTSISKLRNISHQLNTPEFDYNTLQVVIQSYLQQFEGSRLKVDFNCELTQELDHLMQVAIYRVIQESVKNTIKHSNANKCDISIKQSKEEVHLHVKDNGNVKTSGKNGIGLLNMKDRVKSFSGSIKVENKEGFEILISLPIAN